MESQLEFPKQPKMEIEIYIIALCFNGSVGVTWFVSTGQGREGIVTLETY